MKHGTYRHRVHCQLRRDPEPARDIAARAGVTYRQCLDALMYLHLREQVVRIGQRKFALWRQTTATEAADAARRQANADSEAKAEARARVMKCTTTKEAVT